MYLFHDKIRAFIYKGLCRRNLPSSTLNMSQTTGGSTMSSKSLAAAGCIGELPIGYFELTAIFFLRSALPSTSLSVASVAMAPRLATLVLAMRLMLVATFSSLVVTVAQALGVLLLSVTFSKVIVISVVTWISGFGRTSSSFR
jgi:hypothetical protein